VRSRSTLIGYRRNAAVTPAVPVAAAKLAARFLGHSSLVKVLNNPKKLQEIVLWC